MKSFYEPTDEQIRVLSSSSWCCSYSGGKDSTSLVSWIEWLRRSGRLAVKEPQLVQSDTGVEYEILRDVSESMMDVLRGTGWGGWSEADESVEPPSETPLFQEKIRRQALGGE